MPGKYETFALQNIGKKIGYWTIKKVLSKDEAPNRTKWYVQATCDCGEEKPVIVEKIFNGNSTSCGCARNADLLTHGLTSRIRGGSLKEYAIWNVMKQRCLNKKNKQYSEYGGRGIEVCERWLSFENFISDMGERTKKGLSLERVDNEKGYSPENCVWANRNTQNNNKRNNRPITVNGETKNLGEWAAQYNIGHATIIHRINAGWDIKTAVTKPARAIKSRAHIC